MLAKAISAAVLGVDAYKVEVEVDIAGGLPKVYVVGLPGMAVQESKERVRSAIKNAGYPFPASRIVINLAPADIRKEGPAFDLPIALAILAAQGIIPKKALESCIVSGELALDGTIRAIRGAINIALFAAETNIKKVILPPDNAAEAAVIDDLKVYAPKNLADCIEFFRNQDRLEPVPPKILEDPTVHLDFYDVKGQIAAKRALEIAAAGAHNVLMTGPPGSGKTMLAKRIPGILPPLERHEAIEVTRIHSTAGTLKASGLIRYPPFRSPHHTVSDAGLIGGGNIPKPGEVSLAHRGVLFLDEFPEFSRRALEVLRQPIEDGVVTIARARASLSFPARFMLLASQNPCPCGYYGDNKTLCTCSANMRQRYQDRISGPLLDRIDLRITVARLPTEDLIKASSGEKTEVIRKRVLQARAKAIKRQKLPNAQLSGQALREHAALSNDAESFIRLAIKQLSLSGRGYDRVLRVARTIADLADQDFVNELSLAEAISYREML